MYGARDYTNMMLFFVLGMFGLFVAVVLVALAPLVIAVALSMIFGLELAFGVWLICCAWAIIVVVGAAFWWFKP